MVDISSDLLRYILEMQFVACFLHVRLIDSINQIIHVINGLNNGIMGLLIE